MSYEDTAMTQRSAAGARGTEAAPDDGACPACGAGQPAPGKITTVFRHGESWAVVRDIPAAICPSCGEEFVDDATAMRLDMMRGQDFADEHPAEVMEVPVFDYRPTGGRAS